MDYHLKNKKIFIAGHNGMVGKAVSKRLILENCEILKVDKKKCNFTDEKETENWFEKNKPDGVIICAARVGGILANASFPVEFLQENLLIQTNIIKSSHRTGVEKLLFLGSSCIYPKFSQQPIKEESLLSGPLEESNEWYAIAKIAGIKLCQAYRKQFGSNFISVMPTNLYGPNDNYDLNGSHVIPALIKKMHIANLEKKKEVVIWGSGKPLREFMYVDDCADGIVFLFKEYSDDNHINLGNGYEISILELAKKIKEIVGFPGCIVLDKSKPDGVRRKLLSSKKLNDLGWKPKITLDDGLEKTYNDFVLNYRKY
tara:strand:- start:18 stop:959 length:942 start_codon:yes stop_codon:yes gene_type:complete